MDGKSCVTFFLCDSRTNGKKRHTHTIDEGKERLNPYREKNKGMHRRRRVDEKSCVTFLLCDTPADASDANLTSFRINGKKTHTTHTHKKLMSKMHSSSGPARIYIRDAYDYSLSQFEQPYS